LVSVGDKGSAKDGVLSGCAFISLGNLSGHDFQFNNSCLLFHIVIFDGVAWTFVGYCKNKNCGKGRKLANEIRETKKWNQNLQPKPEPDLIKFEVKSTSFYFRSVLL